MTAARDLRLQVIDLRVRLERAAAEAFDRVCAPPKSGQQNMVAKRLLFLVALVDASEQSDVHRLARLGGRIYAHGSDVLHSRTPGLDPTSVVVAEWQTVVADIEEVLNR